VAADFDLHLHQTRIWNNPSCLPVQHSNDQISKTPLWQERQQPVHTSLNMPKVYLERPEPPLVVCGGCGAEIMGHTRFVPLCNAHIELSTSTRSPNEYGKGGPLEMADATADLRKSIPGMQWSSRIMSNMKRRRMKEAPLGFTNGHIYASRSASTSWRNTSRGGCYSQSRLTIKT